MFDHADSTEPLTEESCGQGRQSDRRNLSFRRLHAGALWSPAYLSLCRTYQLHRSGITDDQRGVDLTLGEGFIGMIGDSTESIWSLPKERFEAMPREIPSCGRLHGDSDACRFKEQVYKTVIREKGFQRK